MNEVEKMYENAGVEKRYNYIGHYPETDEKGIILPPVYPPFTAEKQIELIKWLMRYDEIHGDYNDDEYGFSTLNYSGKYKKDFEESLASVINNELWQSLTEEEKQQIKEILE